MDEETTALVARVRRFAMPDGDVEPREIVFAQEGEIRLQPGAAWRPFGAEQRMAGAGPDFLWRAKVRMAPLAPVTVVDAFENGAGQLTASLFGLLPVARGRGEEFDRGELQRALAELPWRPFAIGRLPDTAWESPDGQTLRATYDDAHVRASVEFTVDAEGRVTGGSALRPRAVGRTTVDTPWRGVFGEWRRFGRLRIPTWAEVAWILPDGPFPYWRGRIVTFPEL